MKKGNWKVTCTAAVLICFMATGYLAVAAEYGSKDDPLITLSYINSVLTPATNLTIDQAFATTKTQVDAQITKKIAELTGQVDAKIKDFEGGYTGSATDVAMIDAIANEVVKKLSSGSVSAATTWQTVTLAAGKTLAADIGCEILLRSGSSKCVAYGTPGLINLSSGADLANGGAIAANNLYLVTSAGRGVKSVTSSVILINGKYTIV